MESLLQLLDLSGIFGVELAALMGLIALDVILGVAAAIRTKTFVWEEVAGFYRTMIVPFLLGWLAFAAAANVVPQDVLGPYTYVVTDTTVHGAFLAIVASLVSSIRRNAKTVYSGQFPWEEEMVDQISRKMGEGLPEYRE